MRGPSAQEIGWIGEGNALLLFPPDRKLETGAAGSDQAGIARDPRNRRAGDNDPRGTRRRGDATTGRGAGQAESSGL